MFGWTAGASTARFGPETAHGTFVAPAAFEFEHTLSVDPAAGGNASLKSLQNEMVWE